MLDGQVAITGIPGNDAVRPGGASPSGSIALNSKFVLTDLSLSEPPNGLIYRALKLPAPLDAAIGGPYYAGPVPRPGLAPSARTDHLGEICPGEPTLAAR